MNPAAHWVDEQPMLALRRARRAWERSQPQLTIPAFWDGLDDESLTACASAQQGAARTGLILEPGQPHRGTSPRPAGLDTTTTEAAANHPAGARGRLQTGA